METPDGQSIVVVPYKSNISVVYTGANIGYIGDPFYFQGTQIQITNPPPVPPTPPAPAPTPAVNSGVAQIVTPFTGVTNSTFGTGNHYQS